MAMSEEDLTRLMREGAATYLDALCAFQQFKTHAAETSRSVLRNHIVDLAKSMKLPAPSSNDVVMWCNPDGVNDPWQDDWAFLSSRIWFPPPCKFWFYLGVSFEREKTKAVTYVVCIYGVENAALFKKFKTAFQCKDHFYCDETDRECQFYWKWDSKSDLRSEFEKMMVYVTAAWKGVGGWTAMRA